MSGVSQIGRNPSGEELRYLQSRSVQPVLRKCQGGTVSVCVAEVQRRGAMHRCVSRQVMATASPWQHTRSDDMLT